MDKSDEKKPAKPSSHWLLWTLVGLFIVGAIMAMMMADYYFAPGSAGTSSEPKDAAEK